MNVKIIIERLKRRWFPNQDDKVWKRWVNYKKAEIKHLIELLDSDARESLKMRAVFLLLVPFPEFNPLFWPGKIGEFNYQPDFLRKLSPNLANYAANLIVQFCTTLKPLHDEKPKHYAEGGGGVTFYYSVPSKCHDALWFYNSCILTLLEILPCEKQERIFNLYSLNDISTYCGMEEQSGYGPFRNLLYSNVDEGWKMKADALMIKIIMKEQAGKTKPREEWEDALKCYAGIVDSYTYYEKPPYSVDMYADQVNFVTSKEYWGKKLTDNWSIADILKILSADNYKTIRYQLAKSVVLGSEEGLIIWNPEVLEGAEMILAEFGGGNEEMAQKIQPLIENYKKKILEFEKQKGVKKEEENKLLEDMK